MIGTHGRFHSEQRPEHGTLVNNISVDLPRSDLLSVEFLLATGVDDEQRKPGLIKNVCSV